MDITPCPESRRTGRRVALLAGGALWLAVVMAGFVSLFRYSAEPGGLQAPPSQWPTRAPIHLDATRPTLVLFAHPHCPCTRATIAELDRLMAMCAGGLVAHVIFYADPQFGEGWERTALWEHAGRIPGVHVLADAMGAAARAFCAQTSGCTLVYAPDGRLLFYGGITGARGHEGDNPGVSAIVEIASGSWGPVRTSAVYGCELFERCLGNER
ncbi:MAG TPA: hypothetical protein VFZ65_00935 [Planctomycetota bacterium]|nr:hypothetical protein [Planctomycetota bacterium]